MTEFLIVGYGNTLRGDDGLGPFIADSLDADRVPAHVRLRVLCLPQPDISLAAVLPAADVCIFVDARHDDDTILVRVERVVPYRPDDGQPICSHTTHTLSLSVLIGLAGQWYGNAPFCYLVQPKGFDFSFGEQISQGGRKAADMARQSIYELFSAH